jgi:hypothetical protein
MTCDGWGPPWAYAPGGGGPTLWCPPAREGWWWWWCDTWTGAAMCGCPYTMEGITWDEDGGTAWYQVADVAPPRWCCGGTCGPQPTAGACQDGKATAPGAIHPPPACCCCCAWAACVAAAKCCSSEAKAWRSRRSPRREWCQCVRGACVKTRRSRAAFLSLVRPRGGGRD